VKNEWSYTSIPPFTPSWRGQGKLYLAFINLTYYRPFQRKLTELHFSFMEGSGMSSGETIQFKLQILV
jgi:hypothetical protein